MDIRCPHTIENCIGEKLIFLGVEQEPDGDRVLVENFVQPGAGPTMHVHFLQDEAITVLEGSIGYQVLGGPKQSAGAGETILFKRGVPHKFWNSGEGVLHCKGWIKPANSVVYFLTALFNAQNKSRSAEPEIFDGAFLMTRYRTEYAIPEIPAFVRKTIIPATYMVGKMLGKYGHFKDAPEAAK
jgi:quercetin dioxygenase-like cupin family protein